MIAPERIWADPPTIFDEMDCWHSDPHETRTEYIRADLARPTLTQALAMPEVAALVEALEAKTVMDPNNSNSTWLDAQARAALAALTTATADGGKP